MRPSRSIILWSLHINEGPTDKLSTLKRVPKKAKGTPTGKSLQQFLHNDNIPSSLPPAEVMFVCKTRTNKHCAQKMLPTRRESFFQIFQDNKSFWEMDTIEKRVIYIIKSPQFTPKRHLNQIRKCLSDDAWSGPSEEKEVMDVIYDTFDLPMPQAAPEQCRLKIKRKMTDFIIVNLKRKKYWDSCGLNTYLGDNIPADSPFSWTEIVSLVTLSFVHVALLFFVNIFAWLNSFLVSLFLAPNMATTDINSIWWWGKWSTLSLSLLWGPLWPRVVVPVRVPSMGKIDLFKNHLYLVRPCAKNRHKKQLYKKMWIWIHNKCNCLTSKIVWHAININEINQVKRKKTFYEQLQWQPEFKTIYFLHSGYNLGGVFAGIICSILWD